MKNQKIINRYEGFEAMNAAIRQNLKMFFYTGLFCLIMAMCGTAITSYIWYSELWREILFFFKQAYGIEKLQWAWVATLHMIRKSAWIFVLYSVTITFLYVCIIVWFKRRAKKQSEDRYISGAMLISPDELNKTIKKEKKQTFLNIGHVNIPIDTEPKHTLVVGRPGAGKTVAISQEIEQFDSRCDFGIIYDFKGDYFSKFYNPSRDIFFNPLDARGVSWNLFSEIKTKMDIEAATMSLIPMAEGDDQFWHDGARAILIGVMHFLMQNNKKTNKALWEAVTANVHDLSRWLKEAGDGGKAGYIHLQDPSARHVGGMLSTLQQYTRVFEYMARAGKTNFCIADWVEKRNGWIFLSNYPDLQDTLRPVLSLFLDIISRRILSMPDDRERRIPIIIDEFGTLQKLTSLQNLLTLGRSKGACVTLGIQDLGQIERIYTKDLRQSIVNACGSAYIFSVSDPDTAGFLSDKIGDIQYSFVDRTQSYGVENAKDALSLARKEKTKKLVLPSDIMNLRDLELFMKLPDYFITKTCLARIFYIEKNIPFMIREDLKINDVIQPYEEDPLDRLFSSGIR